MRWFKRAVAIAVLSMTTALAGVGASYGQDKVVRIGFQKYGKLVLLKSKATLEDRLKAAGYRVVWTEFPSGPEGQQAEFGRRSQGQEGRAEQGLQRSLSTGQGTGEGRRQIFRDRAGVPRPG